MYSSSAFSFVHEFSKDPLRMKYSLFSNTFLMTTKTPTRVLFDKRQMFLKFGLEAENDYFTYVEQGVQGDYYFFRRFKRMIPHNMEQWQDCMLEDVAGRKMDAMDVFSACINFLRDDQMLKLSWRFVGITDIDIRWVLTVPAFWKDATKHFMMLAAQKAGINSDHLLLVPEPEAASLYCQYLLVNTLTGQDGGSEQPSANKSKYLIFDARGSAIDISIHVAEGVGAKKQVYKASGGNWGGNFIDKAFRDFLAVIVGNDVMDNFQVNCTLDYIALLRDFEIKKKHFNNEFRSITFRIPASLIQEFENSTRKRLADHIKTKPEYKDKVNVINDKLRIEPELAKDFYKETGNSVASHLKSLFSQPEFTDVSTIFMIGGFSESRILQDMIKKTLSKKRIIIPENDDMAVVKGAVISGHQYFMMQKNLLN